MLYLSSVCNDNCPWAEYLHLWRDQRTLPTEVHGTYYDDQEWYQEDFVRVDASLEWRASARLSLSGFMTSARQSLRTRLNTARPFYGLSKWQRITAIPHVAAAREGHAQEKVNGGSCCAACSTPGADYFRCAECEQAVHSPLICGAVLTCEQDGQFFCSVQCKEAFDDEDTLVCNLRRVSGPRSPV